jgi:hypothetical protein
MADFKNIPASNTEFVPTVGQPSALDTEHQRLVQQEEAQKVKDNTTFGELIGAHAVTGKIGWIDRTIQSFEFDKDPSFVGKKFEDARAEWVKRGIPESQLALADKAVSQEHMDRLYGYALENANAERTMAQFGAVSNLAAGITDPVEFGIGALAAPLGFTAKAGRVANAMRAGLVNAAQGATSEALTGQFNPTVDGRSVLSAAALSFGLGSALGFRPGEVGAMQKAADEIANGPKVTDSMGAARVKGTHVDTIDGPDVPIKDWQQQILDEAALHSSTKETKWAKARVSLAAKLGDNPSGAVSNESKNLLRDGLGYKDKNVAVEESASEMSLRLRDTKEAAFRRSVEPLWEDYKKANGLHFDYGKEEFMSGVGRAMRDPNYKASPEAAGIRDAVNKATRSMWDDLHAAGVEGFESPTPPHQNWLPRQHSATGWIDTLQTKGLRFVDIVDKLIAPAISEGRAKAGMYVDDEYSKIVAEAWGRRGFDKATRSETANPGGAFHARDVDTVEQLLKDAGATNKQAGLLLEKLRKQETEGSKLSKATRPI